MLTRRRKPVSPPGTVRAAVAGAMTQRLTIEELEPWILMSADPAPWLAVIGAPPTTDALHERLGVADGASVGLGTVGSTALDLDALVASSAAQLGAAGTRVELAFIDSRIAGADRDAMLADLASRTDAGTRLEVVVIDSSRDGLAQIDAALAGREDVAALHIVSHGEQGELFLGDSVIDAAVLQSRAAELAGWQRSLTADADILLYGCDAGAGAAGRALVQTLASLTGADVAASDNLTGAAASGGDWNFEVRTGAIESDVAFSCAFRQSWQGTLAITTGTTTDSGTAAATSLTWSHTVASGTDRLLVVSATVSGTAGITSITYGGQALTLLDSATRGGGGGVTTQLWYLVAPAQGTANVVLTANQSTGIGTSATTFFGVNQTQPFGTSAAANGSGTAITGATVSSAAGELVVDSVAVLHYPALTAGAGQTELFELGASGGAVASSTEPGAASVTMSWTASGSGSGPAEWALVAAPIKPANTAPVLDVTKSPALGAVNEDAGAPVGAVGTLVSSLVDFAVPSGQVDNVTDPDSGALLGIAVSGADATNGTWWYSTNNGGSWLALGAVSDANARLLAADGTTRLYFQPNANYNGTLASAVTFRAWDRTSGSNGTTADTTVNGGKSAFSTARDTARLVVNAVNDAPTTSPVTLASIAEDSGPRTITSAELLANASDVDGDPLTVAGVAIASGGGSLVNNGNGTWTYTPAANDSSSVSFSYTINDGQGGSVGGSATLDLTPVNSAPTITSNGGGPSAALGLAENTGTGTVVTSADVDGDPIVYSIAGGSDAGQFQIDSATGALTFPSPPNYEVPRDSDGDDVYQVIVRAADGQGGAVTQTLSITITNVDEAPAVGADSFSDASEQQLIIGATQLLANDQDPEGSTLQIVSVSSPINGTLQQDSAGSWRYTPLPGFAGSDQFTYTVADASGHSSAGQVVIVVTATAPVATTDPTPPTVAPAPSTSTTGTAGTPSAGARQSTPGTQLGGGGPVLPVFDPALGGLPGDFGGSEAATATWTPAEIAASAGAADVSRASFIAFEDARVENPRSWTPSSQYELEEITASMNSTEGQMLMLARNAADVDTSRSLAVVDESYNQLLGPADRTSRGVAQIVMGSSLAFSAGIVAWLLRGGALAASLLSVLPAWVAFDPVPILVRRRRDRKQATSKPVEDAGETAVTRVLRPDARSPRADRS